MLLLEGAPKIDFLFRRVPERSRFWKPASMGTAQALEVSFEAFKLKGSHSKPQFSPQFLHLKGINFESNWLHFLFLPVLNKMLGEHTAALAAYAGCLLAVLGLNISSRVRSAPGRSAERLIRVSD